MASLPFKDREFDTVILDDVLGSAKDPQVVLVEAVRLLKNSGRLLLLQSIGDTAVGDWRKRLADWAAAAQVRLPTPNSRPNTMPGFRFVDSLKN